MKICELNEPEWSDWVKTRPDEIKKMIETHPPDKLYLYKPTNHRVTIHGYAEDGTIIINVTGDYNYVVFDRRVFGVDPKDLEECDLPPEGTKLGRQFTEKSDIEDFIKMQQEKMKEIH